MHLFNFAYFGIVTVAKLLCVLPVLHVIIPLMFVLPVYVYNTELSVSEILKIIHRLGHKKWSLTFIITLFKYLVNFLNEYANFWSL